MDFEDIAVVMITLNEGRLIESTIREVKKNAPGAQIIVVDSSTDDTPKRAKKLGAVVIRQFPPRGYGPAMIKALLTPDKKYIVTVDGDNTYPASTIPKLINKLKKDYAVVGGSRFARGKPPHLSWANYLVNLAFAHFATLIFGQKVSDLHSGMRAYRRAVLHSIPWGPRGYVLPGLGFIRSGVRGHALPVELLLKPIARGHKVTEIPIAYSKRAGESKLDKFRTTIWTLLRIINSRFV